MTKEQVREFLPIIQAFAEGKPIQGRNKISGGNWIEASSFLFLDGSVEYRLKPEPMEIKVWYAQDCQRFPRWVAAQCGKFPPEGYVLKTFVEKPE